MGRRLFPRHSQTRRIDGNHPSVGDSAAPYVPWPTMDQLRRIVADNADVPGHATVQVHTHDWFWPRWSWTIWIGWRSVGPGEDKP